MYALKHGVNDYRAFRYFQELEEIIGKERAERRLTSVRNQIKNNSGLYLRDWVMPRTAWWRGFGDALDIVHKKGSFRRNLTQLMEAPLQTAVKLSALNKTFSTAKKNELSARLSSKDPIEPTLLEIDAAAHYLTMGFDIGWLDPSQNKGVRTPEFLATHEKRKQIIEVECKAKQADSGRMIEREVFYRITDRLVSSLHKKELSGWVNLVVPQRLPRSTQWAKEIDGLILQTRPGKGTFTLSQGESITYSLRPRNEQRFEITKLPDILPTRPQPYSHFAFSGDEAGGFVVNPIVLRLESQKADQFLADMYESLEDAATQFSRKYAAVINCFVPEVESFAGLEVNSSLTQMTASFFDKRRLDFLYAVTYISEIRRDHRENIISSDMPTITFYNPYYSAEFGGNFPVHNGKASSK